jgi:dUTP pyrophosphatase
MKNSMENILICTYDENLLPVRKTPESIWWDIKTSEDFTLQPWELKLIPSWIKTVMPVWWCCKIYARSSLPCKNWLMLWNSVALIDSDYRWEYFMQIYNFTDKPISIEKYTRLCQLEFAPHHWWENNFWSEKIPWIEVKVDKDCFDNFADLYPSERGAWGLWSTWNK